MTYSQESAVQQLKQFESHYNYDASYLFDLLKASPSGFEKFVGFMPLSQHREAASAEAISIAHLIATQSADCGPCLELVKKMAIESGLSDEIIQSTLSNGDVLPDELKLVRSFAIAVLKDQALDPDLHTAMIEQFGESAVAELAITLATATVYPVLKRGLGKAVGCNLELA
ncbi:hypothetical protein MLD52_16505 [Puniceicoccaceae bacterium K14]|nr:hypothetical protein [Puniceicoccaceae bacterium K14]